MTDRQALYAQLRQLMLRGAASMTVAKDEPGALELHAPWPNPRKPKEPMWFGAVKSGKAYVSYHLMPLYTDPRLADSVPEPLRRRMQGKTCFNFKAADGEQLAELGTLTARCASAYEKPPTE